MKPESVDGYIVGINPGDRDDVLGQFAFSKTSVDACVIAASRAAPIWRNRKLADRCAAIRKVREFMSERQEQLALLISRETGKPIWEAQQEVVPTGRAVDLLLDDGLPYHASKIIDPREARSEARPRGGWNYRPLQYAVITHDPGRGCITFWQHGGHEAFQVHSGFRATGRGDARSVSPAERYFQFVSGSWFGEWRTVGYPS